MNELKNTDLVIPGRKKDQLNIHFAPADKGGTSFHWMYVPAKCMNDQGLASATVSRALDLTADVTIIQRQQKTEIIGGIKAIQARGGVVFYWLEDQIWLLPFTSPVRREYTPDKQRDMEKIISACDGAVCSSEALGKYMVRHNDNVSYLPHLLLKEWGTKFKSESERKDGQIRILWTTTAHHKHDFPIIEHALKDVTNKYPNVQVIIWGFVTQRLVEMIPWGRLEYYDWVPIDQYYRCLQSMDADIGIAPLDDTDTYNRAKTPLKFLEYGLMGMAPVVSNVLPYECVIDRETGMVPKTNKHKYWVAALSELVEDAKLRKKIAKNANEWVLENHTDEKVADHIEVYRATFEKKREEKAKK